jgi:ABC-type polysaccharide/polyol phosphate export permease
MAETIRELIARRDLLFIMAWREIRIKYKQSVMGILWAVLMPVVIICAGLIVRFAMAAVSGKPVVLNDLASVAVKAAPWAFFVSTLRFGTNSMINSAQLVTKIYLPRLIFPLSSVLAQLLDFSIAACAVAVFLVLARVGVSIQLLWLPLLLGALVVFTTALAIMFSAASLFLRDVKYLVDVFLSFAIFFTPVFYESSLFGDWAPLLLANPVSPLLEGISSVVIHHVAPSLPWVAYSCAVAAALFALSIRMFRALEPRFAESI